MGVANEYVLAGDIGGTKTNLAIYQLASNGVLELIQQQQFNSQSYAVFENLLTEFISSYPDVTLNRACIGIAGPIDGDQCTLTNLPWFIDSNVISKKFKINKVSLLNDLAATAYGMLFLDESEFIELNPDGINKEGNKAVIAAGTGLGEGLLYWDGLKYSPVASEGGHCDFAPLTPQQDALLVWMRERYPEHVSLERILCGPAIENIYQFLKDSHFAKADSHFEQLMRETDDVSRLISETAIQKGDSLCEETLRLFVEIYGAEASNLALKYLSTGGVFIGGGIAPKILPLLSGGVFFNAFLTKGRFKPLLKKMSVKVSKNQHTALLGAAHFAAESMLE